MPLFLRYVWQSAYLQLWFIQSIELYAPFYLTGASLFTLTATIFLSIGFYLTTLDVSASDRKEIQSIISQVSQDKNIASAIELNQRNNYELLVAVSQKKNLTYSDLGSIQYGQVRDTVNLTKYSQYKTLVNAEY